MNDPIRILVFGGIGVGKTSLINLLTERTTNGNSSVEQFIDVPVLRNKKIYIFTDVVGFDLTDQGFFIFGLKFSDSEAEKNLKNFLKKINSGYNLVIHVIKRQALLETDKINYDIIVKNIFDSKIKTMCVVNFSEDEDKLEDYWANHSESLKQRGLFYENGVAACSGHSKNKFIEHIFKELRKKSYDSVWSSIENLTSTNEKVKPVFSFFENFNIGRFICGLNSLPDNEGIDSEDENSFEHVQAPAKVNLFIFGYDLNLNDSFISSLFYNERKSKKQNANGNFCQYECFKNNFHFIITSINLDEFMNSKNFLRKFLNLLKSSKLDLNYVFIFLDSFEEKKSEINKSKIYLILNYFSVESAIVAMICPEKIYNESNSKELMTDKKKIYSKCESISHEIHFTQVLCIINENNKMNEVFTKYWIKPDEKLWTLINDTFEKKFNQNIGLKLDMENIYYEMNWPHEPPFSFCHLGSGIDIYECALFADCSNMNESSLNKIKEKGWYELPNSETYDICKNGYFAVAFCLSKSNYELVVISHRGTKFNQIGNFWADIEIALQKKPIILNEAKNYEKKIIYKLKNKSNKLKIIHIGFSLGGFIAASCATENLEQNIEKFAITLDSPGTILNEIDKERILEFDEKIVNYFLTPNIVNTCNDHLGKKFEISSNLPKPNDIVNIQFNLNLEAISKELDYALRSHDLDLILELTKNYNKLKPVSKWPIANNKMIGIDWSHTRNNIIVYDS